MSESEEDSAGSTEQENLAGELRSRDTTEMTGVLGNLGPFDDSVEQWSAYTERFEFFVAANGISDGKKVATFLTVMGAKI